MTPRRFAVLVLCELALAALFAIDSFVEWFALDLIAPSPVCFVLAGIVVVGGIVCFAIALATPGVWS